MDPRTPDARENAEVSTASGERRTHERSASKARVRVRLETRELDGIADNVSHGGVLFFSPGDLRVSVEVEEHGRIERRTGHVVRAQSMRGREIGWAIEFDPS